MLSPTVKKLLLLSAFCCVLVLFRFKTTDTLSYFFLPGNLLLAWIPLASALLMRRQEKTIPALLCFLVWLPFFPNAPYIITDLVHLRPRNDFPLWFDSILLYSFAFTGLVVGMYSAVIIYNRLKELMPRLIAKGIMLSVMLISGYGIYIGRCLRWNSWDLLTDPTGIYYDTIARLAHPFSYPRTYGMTLVVGVLLCLVFSVFESFTQKYEA